MMRVVLTADTPAKLTQPDGTVREDYTLIAGEVGGATYEGFRADSEDFYTVTVDGMTGRAVAVHVPKENIRRLDAH